MKIAIISRLLFIASLLNTSAVFAQFQPPDKPAAQGNFQTVVSPQPQNYSPSVYNGTLHGVLDQVFDSIIPRTDLERATAATLQPDGPQVAQSGSLRHNIIGLSVGVMHYRTVDHQMSPLTYYFVAWLG